MPNLLAQAHLLKVDNFEDDFVLLFTSSCGLGFFDICQSLNNVFNLVLWVSELVHGEPFVALIPNSRDVFMLESEF